MWSGDPSCQHEWADASYQRRSNDGGKTTKQLSNTGANKRDEPIEHSTCARCGAWRGTLGLEPTPDLYVQHIVEVFREVRRVMRKDATLWCNLGDSYANAAPRGHFGDQGDTSTGAHGELIPKRDWSAWSLKPKDLAGIPWRVAFALQADGWWLRSDIIWSKPNPMPESVTDRCTKAHEYVFLLAKSKKYYYDGEAIREKGSGRVPGNKVPQKGVG